jgi:hypothetical protein
METNMLGISGSVFRCHKCVIASISHKLSILCNQTPVPVNAPHGNTKDSSTAIPVYGITTDGFTSLLKWVYLVSFKLF